MKIGVTYTNTCGLGEKKLHKLDKPTKDSQFWDLLDTLGHRIKIKGWTKFTGDMLPEGVDTLKDTYYTNWNDVEVLYHIAPWFNDEQHRRLLGNDIIHIIYFDDSVEKFDPQFLTNFSNLAQIFSVVQPIGNRFSVSFYTRGNIPSFEPFTPPTNCILSLEEVRDFVLTRSYNGSHMVFTVPPMNLLHSRPRERTIASLAAKFPKQKK
eukprot:TRINITY_DN3200_c0_g1_i1.p1 TRINITY_DN3200_c0_g1~~TRINITY_DN3200_c0_g1_i1.p1  ORF type:complete len:208 (-),score=14.68 TRINITY_DN3200_c0_g1_i1:290-913(-)